MHPYSIPAESDAEARRVAADQIAQWRRWRDRVGHPGDGVRMLMSARDQAALMACEYTVAAAAGSRIQQNTRLAVVYAQAARMMNDRATRISDALAA